MTERFQSAFARLWLGPLVIAAVSAAALYLALIDDGVVDVISGVALTVIGLIGLSLLRKRKAPPQA